MKRVTGPIRQGLALVVLAVVSLAAGGQSPTSAQMELLRQLPPAEQQRLMREHGIQQPRQVDQRRPDENARELEREWERERDRERRERREPVLDPATGLPMFGYDLFRREARAFEPVTDIPVPVDYVLGPGDVIQVQLLGRTPASYPLIVSRDGAISFPELGPITVAGLSFDNARQLIQERVSQQMIGTSASITMGELRSIRVFVLGDVEHPGSHTVSSLSTMTHALFVSGGISPIGSLRNVELRRNGDLVSTLDLYELLLRGDSRNDRRLNPGDVIFVPPVGAQAGIDGEVRRPGVYEIKGPATAGDLVSLAGGFSSTAFPQGATLQRIDERQERVIEDLDLKSSAGGARVLRKGDVLRVPAVLDRVDNAVQLVGHVFRPTRVQYRPGMRISDLVPSLRELRPLADSNYVLIRRELQPDRRIVALSADLAAALAVRGSAADVLLEPGDRVHVFGLEPVELPPLPDNAGVRTPVRNGETVLTERPRDLSVFELLEEEAEALRKALQGDRQAVVEDLIRELRLQATRDRVTPIVRVGGRVRSPGLYPLEPGMRVSDLLRAGGSLAESAYVLGAEVTRYEVIDNEYREAEVIGIDLAAIRAGEQDADLVLQPFDFLNVKEVTAWREQESVTLVGEVRFPGTYPIRRGETLASVVERAGGLTDSAYPQAAVFTRERIRDRELQQVRELTRRMEADLAALAMQEAQADDRRAGDTLSAGRALLAELRDIRPVGRLALDLPRVLNARPGSSDDLVLEDGDVLMVPGAMQFVTVLGEVQSPTSLLFAPELDRDQYIALSGGMTRRADASRVYVVRANGQVVASGSRQWFRSAELQIQPGDTIVVPTDIERMRPLQLWTAVTQVIYNTAIALLAISSI